MLAYEEMIPYPSADLAIKQGFDVRVIQSYFAQLYLRKSLNQIHSMLYDPQNPMSEEPEPAVIEAIQNSLDMQFVPPQFKFGRDDPPANDILSARLRAKYWGANVITYRPFVKKILLINYNKSQANNGMGSAAPSEQITPAMIEYAKMGIKALVESTRAFHGLPEKRFIVTNIFGTSHA